MQISSSTASYNAKPRFGSFTVTSPSPEVTRHLSDLFKDAEGVTVGDAFHKHGPDKNAVIIHTKDNSKQMAAVEGLKRSKPELALNTNALTVKSPNADVSAHLNTLFKNNKEVSVGESFHKHGPDENLVVLNTKEHVKHAAAVNELKVSKPELKLEVIA